MRVELTESAKKQLKKIDPSNRNRILKYLFEVEKLEDLRSRGEALLENMSGLWRYRIGDYRAICEIQEEKIVISVLKIGHRKDIYG